MRRQGALDRILKSAAPSTGDPGADAMNAAAQAANGPAGMGLLQMPDPTKKDDNLSQDALRMAHELDSKNKEINGLRQQLQEAKMDSMRTQLKAEIEQEQTKLRESMHQEQQKMRDFLRKEQVQLQNQIRSEQKELDKKQSELQIAEAQQKGNITAAKAQYEAEHTAAEADHKAKIAIEQAQHQAQLDKDVSAHDVQIAQNKADSLMDIAQQTTDMYVKQTEKARADADKYFAGQQQQFDSSHPVISPALQSRLDGAMKSVGRIGKSLNMMMGKGASAAFLEKWATQGEGTPNYPLPPAPPPEEHKPKYVPMTSNEDDIRAALGDEPSSPTEDGPVQYGPGGSDSYFQQFAAADDQDLVGNAKALAAQENEIYKMQQEHADPDTYKGFLLRHELAKTHYEALKADIEERAKAGDRVAKEQLAQLDDASQGSGAWWWEEESDLDKIRNRYKNAVEERNHGWFYKNIARPVGHAVDFISPLARSISDQNRVQRMFDVRGANRTWWGDLDDMDPRQRLAAEAAERRGLKHSIMGATGDVALGLGMSGLALASDAAILTGVGALAGGARTAGSVALQQAGKAGTKALANAAGKAGANELATTGANAAAQVGKSRALSGMNNATEFVKNNPKLVGGLVGVGAEAGLQHATGTTGGYYDPKTGYRQGNDALPFLNQNGQIDLGNGWSINAETGRRERTIWNRPLDPRWSNAPLTPAEKKRRRDYYIKHGSADSFLEKWAAVEDKFTQSPRRQLTLDDMDRPNMLNPKKNQETLWIDPTGKGTMTTDPQKQQGDVYVDSSGKLVVPETMHSTQSSVTPTQHAPATRPQAQAPVTAPPPGSFNSNAEADRLSYQNDPTWGLKTREGAHFSPFLDAVAPIIESLVPGLVIHPKYPMFPDMRERYDENVFLENVLNNIGETRDRKNRNALGRNVNNAWGEYVGSPYSYMGVNMAGAGWVPRYNTFGLGYW